MCFSEFYLYFELYRINVVDTVKKGLFLIKLTMPL